MKPTSLLRQLMKPHEDESPKFIIVKHVSAHSLRKGSASHATSYTTPPPSFVSVATRGEWSASKEVMDSYFKSEAKLPNLH
mmetsp:Transcript_5231/g.11359  ORF Transcript_5231/g.11359 Transcript_5231/m.11359 type:complete len:81 (+) Transcript_5231:164-406(+)